MRLMPPRYLQRRTLSELSVRTDTYPELSMGDLVARCFHDWDNAHGLAVDGGGVVFGDGAIHQGVTAELAIAAAGRQRRRRGRLPPGRIGFEAAQGEALYDEVRRATGAGATFVAETLVPRISDGNPPQNWQAPDAETLWETPIVGDRGPTVGEALVEMLEPDGQFIRQLDSLGEGLAGSHGPFGLPVVGPWLSRRCCQAFHHGFVEPLAREPAPMLLDLVHGSERSKVPAGTRP